MLFVKLCLGIQSQLTSPAVCECNHNDKRRCLQIVLRSVNHCLLQCPSYSRSTKRIGVGWVWTSSRTYSCSPNYYRWLNQKRLGPLPIQRMSNLRRNYQIENSQTKLDNADAADLHPRTSKSTVQLSDILALEPLYRHAVYMTVQTYKIEPAQSSARSGRMLFSIPCTSSVVIQSSPLFNRKNSTTTKRHAKDWPFWIIQNNALRKIVLGNTKPAHFPCRL